MDRVRHLSFHPLHIDHLIAQHDEIVRAIVARDPDAAERIMRAHLREIIASLADLVAERPDLFAQNEKHHRRKTDATT
jgi:DNA-binding GntR family transcriptional regulator